MYAFASRSIFVEQFRQTEIQDLRLSRVRDHHVTGFDVSMNDAFGVRAGKGVRDLDGDGESAL